MRGILWARIAGSRKGKAKMIVPETYRENPEEHNRSMPSADHESAQVEEKSAVPTSKNGSVRKEDGPLRMHQVPWIGIR